MLFFISILNLGYSICIFFLYIAFDNAEITDYKIDVPEILNVHVNENNNKIYFL